MVYKNMVTAAQKRSLASQMKKYMNKKMPLVGIQFRQLSRSRKVKQFQYYCFKKDSLMCSPKHEQPCPNKSWFQKSISTVSIYPFTISSPPVCLANRLLAGILGKRNKYTGLSELLK